MRFRAIDTRWLTHASFMPAARDRRWQRWQIAGAAAILLLLVAASRGLFGDLFATSRDLAAAREEQAVLAAEVERLRTRLAVEGATRSELEQHAAELNTQVAELTRQVEFLTTRRAAGARTN